MRHLLEDEIVELVVSCEVARENGERSDPRHICQANGRPDLASSVEHWLSALDSVKVLDTLDQSDIEEETVDLAEAYDPQSRNLGRLQVDKTPLGAGGMGVVYRAYDPNLEQHVAVKVMKSHQPKDLLRFKREFRNLIDLHHRNLVTLFELTVCENAVFFTMEIVEGHDFATHIHPAESQSRSEPLQESSLRRLYGCLYQLANALNYIHREGLLHLDIKPANVLVTPQARVVLLDFGISAQIHPLRDYVPTDLRGSLDYLAPEQICGEAVSAATDWYSVGVMLYHALTGQMPFAATNYKDLAQRTDQSPVPPREISSSVPSELADLCMELLRRDPTARPSGHAVLETINRGGPLKSSAVAEDELCIGRSSELGSLHAAFDRTKKGETSVCAIHGRSGVGKTSIVREFLTQLDSHHDHEQFGLGPAASPIVLAGRCYQQENMPYKALDGIVDQISRFLQTLPVNMVQQVLPVDCRALCRVFEVLGANTPAAFAPGRAVPEGDGHEQRRRASIALRELLARLGARAPLVLVIDDAQWGDADSARMLCDILSPPDAPQLMLVLSFRQEDIESNAFLSGVTELLDDRIDCERIQVNPLSPGECLELIDRLSSGRQTLSLRLKEQIASQSGGYPYLLRELVEWVESKSEVNPDNTPIGGSVLADQISLTQLIRERVAGLPRSSRMVLDAVSLAGRPITMTHIRQIVTDHGFGPGDLTDLRVSRLLRSVETSAGHSLDTYHDRVRESVVESIPEDQKQDLHLRLATVLERAGLPAENLAIHLEHAGDYDRASEFYECAGDNSLHSLAFRQAAGHYRAAIRMLSSDQDRIRRLRTKIGDALAAEGLGQQAANEYLLLAEGANDAFSVDLQRKAALLLLSSGHVEEGVNALRKVLASVRLRLPTKLRDGLISFCIATLRLRLYGIRYRLRGEEDIDMKDLAKLDACQTASIGLSLINPILASLFQTRCLGLAMKVGEPRRLAVALGMQGTHGAIAGSRSRPSVDRQLRAAERLAEQCEDDYLLATTKLFRGIAEALAGRWSSALHLCDEAATRLEERSLRTDHLEIDFELGTSQRFALWPLMYMGEISQIRQRLPSLLDNARDRDDLYGETSLCMVVRTMTILADDQPDMARREIDNVMQRWSNRDFHLQDLDYLHDVAQIDLYADDPRSAWQCLQENWKKIRSSHYLHVQQVRIYMRHLRARIALASAQRGHQSAYFLRRAEADARRLWRERADWSQALAQAVRASAATIRGNNIDAKRLLADTAKRCSATDMNLYAAAARRALANFQNSEAQRRLHNEATQWMTKQGIKNCDRMCEMLMPGFSKSEDS